MTGSEMDDWREDRGYGYKLPLIVDTPNGPRDISEWAAKQTFFRYWLALRSGSTEWNARAFVSPECLRTLEHGKTYEAAEIVAPSWRAFLPKKLQFIVERIKSA